VRGTAVEAGGGTAARPDPRPGPAEATLVWSIAFGQLVAWGTLYYSFSLFVLPMERDLGWSKAELNGALACGLLVSALFAPPVGVWIDRHGGRWPMAAGCLAGAVLLAAWAWTESLWAFYLIWAGIGAVQSATLYEPAFAVLAGDLGARYRRGVVLVTLVGGFASTVFMPLTQLAIDWLGWRDALLALAACNLALVLLHAAAIPPLAPTQPEGGLRPVHPGRPLAVAMRKPAFWLLAACFVGYGAVFSTLTFHIVPLLDERGLDMASILTVIALIGPMQVGGRLLLMAAGERAGVRTVGVVVTLLFPLAILVLLLAPSAFATALLFAVLYGLGNGVMTIVRATVVPELLGPAGYGAINGALTMPTTVARALAPLAAAALWQLSGSYQTVLWATFAVACLSAAAFCLAALHRPP